MGKLNLGFYNFHNKEMQNNKIFEKINILDKNENIEIEKTINRIEKILEKAQKLRPRSSVVMDAEQTYLQYAVHNIIEQIQLKYNNKDTTLMLNTIQAYLKEA